MTRMKSAKNDPSKPETLICFSPHKNMTQVYVYNCGVCPEGREAKYEKL